MSNIYKRNSSLFYANDFQKWNFLKTSLSHTIKCSNAFLKKKKKKKKTVTCVAYISSRYNLAKSPDHSSMNYNASSLIKKLSVNANPPWLLDSEKQWNRDKKNQCSGKFYENLFYHENHNVGMVQKKAYQIEYLRK